MSAFDPFRKRGRQPHHLNQALPSGSFAKKMTGTVEVAFFTAGAAAPPATITLGLSAANS